MKDLSVLESSENRIEEELFLCEMCKKMTSEYSCIDCEEIFYCSEECANNHWPTHERECKASLSKTIKPINTQQYPSNVKDYKNTYEKTEKRSLQSPPEKRFSEMEQIRLIGNPLLAQRGSEVHSPYHLQKQESDNFDSDDNYPKSPELSKENARRRVLYHLWKGNYDRAKEYAEALFIKARNSLENMEADPEYSYRYIFEIMKDFLMYSKCLLITSGNMQGVKETLDFLNGNTLKVIKIDYKKVRTNLSNTELKEKLTTDTKHTPRLKGFHFSKRLEITNLEDTKILLNAYGMMGAMYNLIGNQYEAERTYGKYCRIVEKIYGIQSIEASNCYFYMGGYYFEEREYEKALICMKKALLNRSKEYGNMDIICGDCYFNIGLIHKKLRKFIKAKNELEIALNIKRERIGKYSLKSAIVLEELGKLSLETFDYKSALKYLNECYEIRKKMLKDTNHPDLKRISVFLTFLNRKIQNELNVVTKKSEVKKNEIEVPLHDERAFNNYSLKEQDIVKDIIKCLIFLLSLDEEQMNYLNKIQTINEYLLINKEFELMLSPFQMFLYSHSKINKIPCSCFLMDNKKNVEANNIKVNEEVKSYLAEIVEEDDISRLLEAGFDFSCVLNTWQVRILNRVITYKLPINLFLHCIQDNQIESFKSVVRRELELLEESELILTQYNKQKDKYRTGTLQNKLIEYIEDKLNITTVNLNMGEKFYKNLTKEQVTLIRQINKLKRMLSTNNSTELIIKLKEYLIQFIETLNPEEITQFASINGLTLDEGEHKQLRLEKITSFEDT